MSRVYKEEEYIKMDLAYHLGLNLAQKVRKKNSGYSLKVFFYKAKYLVKKNSQKEYAFFMKTYFTNWKEPIPDFVTYLDWELNKKCFNQFLKGFSVIRASIMYDNQF